ncbi:MAG: SAM-dependent methyltransferase [Eubacteriales bacterium]|nr:SAM-dependent methyltransferase [Eubacteriales bacterium]
MTNFTLYPVGRIINRDGEFAVKIDRAYIPALEGLDGFSHIQLLWWFDGCDNEVSRAKLNEEKPYKKAPDILGTFATRSPERPNPIALSCSLITYIDYEKGIVGLAYTDADDGSPVIDIKPYTPSLDRVENPSVPDWCSHWPERWEDSGDFDWSKVFNF